MILPKVSIVITTYLEASKQYLDACIKSVECLNYPKEQLEVILVGRPGYMPRYENVKTISPEVPEFHNPVGVNFGMNAASPESKHLFMMNDDVILTENSLIKMVLAAADSDVIFGGISNCDNNGLFNAALPLGLNKRQYRYDEIKDKIDDMIKADLPTGPVRLIRPDTLYLYANLFPRRVWEGIRNGSTPDSNGFDETFMTSYDDTDYILRAKQHGVAIGLVTDALIWHCSGTSADKTHTPETRQTALEIFNRKWT